MEIIRKSSQEVEIDHLLAEEFSCDPTFGRRFLTACGLPSKGFRVKDVAAEPSLGGEGYGDLFVNGEMEGDRVALLVEDKITAGPATRQSERYRKYAETLREKGWDIVWTILVAPSAYVGERSEYNASVNLEVLAEIVSASDPHRLAYRRRIIERALQKRSSSGVQVADPALHRLKADYLNFLTDWATATGIPLQIPILREGYYDADSWVYPIRDPRLPPHIVLRHRLWTSVVAATGQVDLIASPAGQEEHDHFLEKAFGETIVEDFSKGKGVQISLRVPEMRQSDGFDRDIASKACVAMKKLIEWYLAEQS